MKLSEWLLANDISPQEFGTRLGDFGDGVPRTQPTVSRWAAGTRMPDKDDLAKIFEATNGQVTPNDFVDLPTLAQSDFPDEATVPETSNA